MYDCNYALCNAMRMSVDMENGEIFEYSPNTKY